MKRVQAIFLALLIIGSATIGCKSIQPLESLDATIKGGNLVGLFNELNLKQEPFSGWYTRNYNAYTIDEAALAKIKPLLKDKTIEVFMGTWCGDSKRETPRFFKMMNDIGVMNQITAYGVSRSKKSLNGEEKGKNIIRVPTFIIRDKSGEEINRIIEYPKETLEKDLLKILEGKKYKPNYSK